MSQMEPVSAIAARVAAAAAIIPTAGEIERVLIGGDLSKLTEAQRLTYYNQVCASLGLNPLTQPFAYIPLQGKLKLYALKDATEQLRKIHGVSITELTTQRIEDVYVVTAKAQDKSGRTDAATGAVTVGNQKGDSLANSVMKAETKAKRRVTLSICGLGMLDETETETIPQPILPTAKPIALPVGTVQVVAVLASEWGGEVTVVDEHGVEAAHKTTERKLIALCEQIQQENQPVTLEFAAITRGKNAGKQKLVGVHRVTSATSHDVSAAAKQSIDDAVLARNTGADVITADDIPF